MEDSTKVKEETKKKIVYQPNPEKLFVSSSSQTNK